MIYLVGLVRKLLDGTNASCLESPIIYDASSKATIAVQGGGGTPKRQRSTIYGLRPQPSFIGSQDTTVIKITTGYRSMSSFIVLGKRMAIFTAGQISSTSWCDERLAFRHPVRHNVTSKLLLYNP